ncbi:MAG: hypothetical protein AAF990_16075 [Bacteroidota bacterium]
MNENHQRMINYYSRSFVDKFSPVAKEMMTHPKERIAKIKEYINYISELGLKLDEQRIEYVRNRCLNNPGAIEVLNKEIAWVKEL